MNKKLIIKNITVPFSKDTESSNIIIHVRPLYSVKKCERGNYIPHTNHSHCNQTECSDAYTQQLDDMYRIVRLAMSSNYKSLNIDWKDPKYAHAFDKLMFNCSSQYILPYLESKDVTNYDKEWEKQNGN